MLTFPLLKETTILDFYGARMASFEEFEEQKPLHQRERSKKGISSMGRKMQIAQFLRDIVIGFLLHTHKLRCIGSIVS